jgi:hypothetical protein
VVPPSKEGRGEVILIWEGIANLHKSFFLDEDAVAQLGRDLKPHIQGPANVVVSFDMKHHIGRIRLRLLPKTAIGLSFGQGDRVGIRGVSALLQALARYRSAVAARYDVRVEAFKISVDAYRGATHCRMGAAGAQPPDGRVVDACVEINGLAHCGRADTKGIRFEPAVAKTIRSCLK